MDDANKILDVTYGSFSCRLEGFEDSVETMKTVVMYFHDLAGHDRFMDMEPQAPDMEELARLTEEQTGTAVEIEGDGQRVSLRAGAALAAAGDAATDEDADLAAAFEDLDEDAWDAEAEAETAETDEDTDVDGDDVADLDDDSEMLDDDAVEDSVADKLQRIKDVVEQDAPIAEAEDIAAEESADDIMGDDGAGDDSVEEDQHAQLTDALDEVAEDATDDLLDEADAALDDAADDYEDTTEYAEDATETVDEVLADDAVAEEMADEHAEADVPSDEDVAADDDGDVIAAEADDADEAAQDDDATEASDGPLVLTSRDAAFGADKSAEDTAAEAEDDFDLQAEVAKIEAELAARKGNSEARHALPRSVDDAMSRILSQTDQHLNQPESRRHRDAFAQLKAAVAATEAARQLGDSGAPAEDPDEAYKDDLGAHDAKERAEAEAEAPAEPDTAKAPPLKLVKTEVLDAPARSEDPAPATEDTPATASQPTDAASLRLREIAARKDSTAAPQNAIGFKEFAESQGAVDVIDMIEAAAAYLYYVDGDPDFSRPQVMKKVQAATGTEISREDGLRAFGRLLRLAKIVKLNNGRFRISESSEYRPDNAQAAQG